MFVFIAVFNDQIYTLQFQKALDVAAYVSFFQLDNFSADKEILIFV